MTDPRTGRLENRGASGAARTRDDCDAVLASAPDPPGVNAQLDDVDMDEAIDHGDHADVADYAEAVDDTEEEVEEEGVAEAERQGGGGDNGLLSFVDGSDPESDE
jgi:hypothetical protein